MSSGRHQAAPGQPSAGELSTDDLARLQGERPVESVDDMARPGLFQSEWEWEEFLANLYASRHSDY
jgi:hypothetical protein